MRLKSNRPSQDLQENNEPDKASDERESLARLKAMLRDAADYEPSQQPSRDFVSRALRGGKSCSTPRFNPFNRTAFMAGMAGVATMGLALLLVRGQAATSVVWNPADLGNVVSPIQIPTKEFATTARPTFGNSASGIITGVNGSRSPQEMAPAAIQPAGYKEEEGDDAPRRSRPYRVRQREDVPKVQWQTEPVQTYRSGIIQQAFVEQRDANGEIIYTPVTLEMPQDTTEHPMPNGTTSDSGYSLTRLESGSSGWGFWK